MPKAFRALNINKSLKQISASLKARSKMHFYKSSLHKVFLSLKIHQETRRHKKDYHNSLAQIHYRSLVQQTLVAWHTAARE